MTERGGRAGRSDGGRRVGCFPGSFNPPTTAHLAVAEAAVDAGHLDRLDLVVSRVALGKEALLVPGIEDRVALLEEVAASRSWLGVAVTDQQLVADVAEGYAAVVMGADKWRQVNDTAWYGTDPEAAATARDDALARLPLVLVAPRADDDLGELADRPGVVVLHVDVHHRHVSATAVRAGAPAAGAWLLPEAAAFDARTKAWSDPEQYRPSNR